MEEGKKAKKTRRRMNESSWREVLTRYATEAVTVQEFCRREGLTRSSFMRWHARLRGGSAPGAAGEVAPVSVPEPKPAFVDLGSLGQQAGAFECGVPVDLRIDLGGGISLHLVRR